MSPFTVPAPSARDITGLLLAGGRGRRVGGADKGLLLLDGKPLALHTLRRLRPQVATVLISANRNAAFYQQWAPVIADEDDDLRGPLAGLLAALGACPTEWLAIAPCDVPALPLDAFERLANALDGAPAAFAVPDGQHHSLVCLLHRSLAPALRNALAAGKPRVGGWFTAVGAIPVRFANAAAFANLNTPADLAAAQASHG
jgi:molybdopterin-guanine dinucleotide biosynthesis protein A